MSREVHVPTRGWGCNSLGLLIVRRQAVGKMRTARRSRLSGAGFKPPQAAVIKSGGRERWGNVEHDSTGVDQEDERK